MSLGSLLTVGNSFHCFAVRNDDDGDDGGGADGDDGGGADGDDGSGADGAVVIAVVLLMLLLVMPKTGGISGCLWLPLRN